MGIMAKQLGWANAEDAFPNKGRASSVQPYQVSQVRELHRRSQGTVPSCVSLLFSLPIKPVGGCLGLPLVPQKRISI